MPEEMVRRGKEDTSNQCDMSIGGQGEWWAVEDVKRRREKLFMMALLTDTSLTCQFGPEVNNARF